MSHRQVGAPLPVVANLGLVRVRVRVWVRFKNRVRELVGVGRGVGGGWRGGEVGALRAR